MISAKRFLILLSGKGPYAFTDAFAGTGALGADWTGSTWARVNGELINTPTLGSELLTNGDMETGNPPTGWLEDTGATLTGVADERTGGSGAQSLNVARNTHFSAAYKSTGSGQVEWHYAVAWMKNISATDIYHISAVGESQHQTSTSWTRVLVTRRIPTATPITFLFRITDSPGQQARLDDASIKKITRSSLFATTDKGFADASLIAPAMSAHQLGTQAGIVMCMDDDANPANFVTAYLAEGIANPQSITIEQCVADTYGAPVTVELAHSLSKHFSAKTIGNQLYVYYGTDHFGTLVGGAPITLNAALVGNTKHGLMSTAEVNKFSGPFVLARYS